MEPGVNDSELPRLCAGQIDLMLGAIDHSAMPGIQSFPLLTVNTTILVRADHPLTRSKRVDIAGLSKGSWVVYRKDVLVHRQIDAYLAGRGLSPPRIAIEVGSLMSAFDILRRTDLLMAAPGHLAPLAASLGLVQLTLSGEIWSFTSGAMIRNSMRNLPITQACLALLRAECARVAPQMAHRGDDAGGL